jgi:hypothetical protein
VSRRARRRERLRAPSAQYRDEHGNVLELRGSLTPATRLEYARIASGEALAPGAVREDAWQRAVEFLFERLAVSWSIAGAEPLRAQRELLARFRAADQAERHWVRATLREHCAAHFPDVAAP